MQPSKKLLTKWVDQLNDPIMSTYSLDPTEYLEGVVRAMAERMETVAQSIQAARARMDEPNKETEPGTDAGEATALES